MIHTPGDGFMKTIDPPPGAVVEAKFHPPRPFAEHVARSRLIERLDEAIDRPLTLVVAPTGFGKSTLLAEWCAQVMPERRCAWLTLDEADNDPIVFWSYVLHALRRLEPACFGEELRSLLTSDASFLHVMVPSVLNTLWSMKTPLILVLDDFHQVTSAECHQTVRYFVSHLPPTVRLVIATRVEPPLGLGTLRARGELAEVRVADLSFTTDESTTFLTDRLGLSLSAAAVEQLTQRTEGWPAGLYLGALSLRDQKDADAFITSFAGSNHHVVDYLGGEVLTRLPKHQRMFLLRTSVLNRLSSPLCAAVLEDSDAETLLVEVERSNLFLVPLDAERHWRRYHHLFQEFLRTTLERLEPDLVPTLHRRAAAWYYDAGEIESAMRHTLAGEDFDVAGTILVEHWGRFTRSGRLTTAHGWLSQFPVDVLAASPSLSLAAAFIASAVRRSPKEVEQFIAFGKSGELDGPLPFNSRTIESTIELLRGAYPYNDVGQVLLSGQTAAAVEIDPSRNAFMIARAVVGKALYLSGRPAEARAVLDEALQSPRAPVQPITRIAACAVLALVYLDLDDPVRAEELARQATEEAAAVDLTHHPDLWWVPMAWGRTLMRSGNLTEAERVLTEGLEHRLPQLREWPLAYSEGLLTLATMHFWRGRTRTAWRLVKEARAVIARCPDPGRFRAMLAETERIGARLQRRGKTSANSSLSEGELRVIRMLPSDLTQREIGQELFISLNTVRTHIRSIYTKLDVNSREEAVARARSLKVID